MRVNVYNGSGTPVLPGSDPDAVYVYYIGVTISTGDEFATTFTASSPVSGFTKTQNTNSSSSNYGNWALSYTEAIPSAYQSGYYHFWASIQSTDKVKNANFYTIWGYD